MSTWQIVSGSGDTFSWKIAHPKPDAEPADAPSSTLLPSMADLLFQGCSELLKENKFGFEKTPMFKTGLGKSVPIKPSSIAKAMSVLDGNCSNDSGHRCAAQVPIETQAKQSLIPRAFSVLGDSVAHHLGQDKARDTKYVPNSLFQTGSGKMVNVSSDGLARAKKLLGLNEDYDSEDGFQDTWRLPPDDLQYGLQNARPETRSGIKHWETLEVASVPQSLSICSADLGQSRSNNEAMPHGIESKMQNSAAKPPPVKFQTAGGRSISVSSDALKRAKSLLGDSELKSFFNIDTTDNMESTVSNKKGMVDTSLNNKNGPMARLSSQKTKSTFTSTSFVSPLRSSSKQIHTPANSEREHSSGTNLMRQFDAVSTHDGSKINGQRVSQQQPFNNGPSTTNTFSSKSSADGFGSRSCLLGKPLGRPLVDISNTIQTASANNTQPSGEKRRFIGASVSLFKRPRTTRFSTPMKSNVSSVPNGISSFSSDHSCPRGRVSMRYPFQAARMSIKEYFGAPPLDKNMVESVSYHLKWIRSDNAENYKFIDESGVRSIGVEAFFHMLVHSGASDQFASKEWVQNHYKWIVWKLACYERNYLPKSAGNFLTISNVLEELKYRYEREVNYGHRSAIKRILEGDASPSSMMVLCIAAIHSINDPKTEVSPSSDHSGTAARVELTDGWYSVDALLDVLLSKQLAAGKLFIGQKLRIWGASLCGWAGPVPPLEVVSTVNLVLHINGTYRAHWADRLGFCKGVGIPLAFKCIKSNGGAVPLTLVGISRIYPVLYKERLNDGRSVVRSERMENEVAQSYDQRRSVIVESIVSEFQRGIKNSHTYNDSDSEEGAQLLNLLEKASEPEILLAGMSPDQISSFTKYQAKLEGIRHSDMERSIEKALENAGLDKREVIPFMRVRVVGLTSKANEEKENDKVGLITIWNPTEKQQSTLAEGKTYNVAGLLPTNTTIDTSTIYMQARDSTLWKPLSPQAMDCFRPFFTPRKSALLANLGEVPLSSEFDIAAFVVFVGEIYKEAHQRKQWVFVSDSSISKLYSEDLSDCLLAICFCSPYIDGDSFVPFNLNLVGSTIGFCNLIKGPKDQMNHLWVAEASENSTYFLTFNATRCPHLKDAALSVEKWGKYAHRTIDKLREKVIFIVGDGKC